MDRLFGQILSTNNMIATLFSHLQFQLEPRLDTILNQCPPCPSKTFGACGPPAPSPHGTKLGCRSEPSRAQRQAQQRFCLLAPRVPPGARYMLNGDFLNNSVFTSSQVFPEMTREQDHCENLRTLKTNTVDPRAAQVRAARVHVYRGFFKKYWKCVYSSL